MREFFVTNNTGECASTVFLPASSHILLLVWALNVIFTFRDLNHGESRECWSESGRSLSDCWWVGDWNACLNVVCGALCVVRCSRIITITTYVFDESIPMIGPKLSEEAISFIHRSADSGSEEVRYGCVLHLCFVFI